MSLAYFDCFSGAAGDMILGALLDAGLDEAELRETVARIPVEGYRLDIRRVTKQSLAATRFEVSLDADRPQPHRHLSDVCELIDRADLASTVRDRAKAIFRRLARAEASVHGTDIEKVHFHEVGAIDAIIDIVGAAWAVERLGIDRIVCSPIAVGGGVVKCAHGTLPVPAPATALLLAGVPTYGSEETGELTTPTGAAVLTESADSFGPLPAMKVESVGYGAGRREGKTRPNVLRVMIGSPVHDPQTDRIIVLQANIDDTTPEIVGHAVERLLNEGALDAYTVPIQMKKSRPAVVLTVLARPADVARLEDVILAETTTFGIRRHDADRTVLERKTETVNTDFGPIAVKIGSRDGKIVTVAPEYEACRAAAERHGVALRAVMAEATAAWRSAGGKQ